ncbi:MAG: heavy metal-associated domain-containing protein [Porticoccaceae bacterium]|nr:heavy metal-associated domain-containing protein [Porticoccaceae bacterium]
MKKLLLAILLLTATAPQAAEHEMEHMHSHKGHVHDTMVDGQTLSVDAERFDNFVNAVPSDQIVVISVQGMVCDFCARGIEKTFDKDNTVTKIDVDLASGKVLLAYSQAVKIDRTVIEKNILNNGLNATAIQVIGK